MTAKKITKAARDEILRLAGEANSERWKLVRLNRIETDEDKSAYVANVEGSPDRARFIAATDPQTVLALIEQLDEYESAMMKAVTGIMDCYRDHSGPYDICSCNCGADQVLKEALDRARALEGEE